MRRGRARHRGTGSAGQLQCRRLLRRGLRRAPTRTRLPPAWEGHRRPRLHGTLMSPHQWAPVHRTLCILSQVSTPLPVCKGARLA